MLKTFHLTGYTTSKGGLIVGFNLNMQAIDVKQAQVQLTRGFTAIVCSNTQITKINEIEKGPNNA